MESWTTAASTEPSTTDQSLGVLEGAAPAWGASSESSSAATSRAIDAALVDEAQPVGVHHDAERVGVLLEIVADIEVAEADRHAALSSMLREIGHAVARGSIS